VISSLLCRLISHNSYVLLSTAFDEKNKTKIKLKPVDKSGHALLAPHVKAGREF